ncbi:MAG TPA: hypothetical protein VNZ53_35950 [Steroidobacteraceae bacterium]|jgi:hypothetical protein|nr:hypothetical protein [Steroidobacteraceae bacterium]
MPTFLQPVELPEKCFLQEVLYWVAFQRLPIAIDSDGKEFRETEDVGDYDIQMPDRYLQADECARANIPPDPRLAALISNRTMTDLKSFDRLMLSGRDYDDETRKVIESQRQEVVQFQKEYEEWKVKYAGAIEVPAVQIFLALKKGELQAKGQNFVDLDFDVEFGPEFHAPPVLDIPALFWSLSGIDFDASAAKNGRDHYYHIFCSTEDVFAKFPGDKREPVDGVERIGTSFLLKETAEKIPLLNARRGRPPTYPWDAFHREVTSLVKEDKLPRKKEACIQDFQDWFRDKFGVRPSRAAVGEKLKPYYDRFVKAPDRKS